MIVRLDAGDVVVAVKNLERYRQAPLSRNDLKATIGLLDRAHYQLGELLRQFRGRLPTLTTFVMEARDISEGDVVYFAMVNETHAVTNNEPSPDERNMCRLHFGSWYLDALPAERFEVVS